MIKKYIQLLLSVNFCLTAISAANPPGSDDYEFTWPDNSKTEDGLIRQFQQIWDSLDKISNMYGYSSLQTVIAEHTQAPFQYNEEIDPREVENQFEKAQDRQSKLSAICTSNYPLAEEVNELELKSQLENIQNCLAEIKAAYEPRYYSKRDNAFLNNELEEFTDFLEKLTSEISSHGTLIFEDGEAPTYTFEAYPSAGFETDSNANTIQALLDECQEEDELIYSQYEAIANGTFKEIKIKEFLTPSQSSKNSFSFFNKDENLIEIQHTQDDGTISCRTIWRICPADAYKVNWEPGIKIHINETSLFSRYNIKVERLDYTLETEHPKSSVRANLICKSAVENIYNILDIDYLNKVVLLNNSLCLFVRDGELEGWHPNDEVRLEVHSSSIDPKAVHALMNVPRNKKIEVSLAK